MDTLIVLEWFPIFIDTKRSSEFFNLFLNHNGKTTKTSITNSTSIIKYKIIEIDNKTSSYETYQTLEIKENTFLSRDLQQINSTTYRGRLY
jgi:hypothetical protein